MIPGGRIKNSEWDGGGGGGGGRDASYILGKTKTVVWGGEGGCRRGLTLKAPIIIAADDIY